MAKCVECGKELTPEAKFCASCGTQVGVEKQVFHVTPDNLVEKFKELAKDASVKRIVVKNESGQTVLSVPATWGAVGAVATLALSPWLAALGVIAAVASKFTIEVEKIPTVATAV
ncbi:MAG TPA: DUF4342 domain-containing protein [Candidatus Bathyarchaeia archaeon]|nr:DUF4342 domain-containing protein [Candidatus Bathyarchaeia archaeon]